MKRTSPNKAGAGNGAGALSFHVGILGAPCLTSVVSPMKRLLEFLWCAGFAASLVSCTLTGQNGEVDSPGKAFLEYGLRKQPEAYLVCIWDVAAKPGGENYADIKATVVETIKGDKKAGEIFSFERISDSDVWDFAHLRGGLYYVFLRQAPDGRVTVDVQDPQALWEYSDELHGIVERYQRRG